MEIKREDWNTILARIEQMPENLKLAMGNFGAMSKKEMIKHLEDKDEVGQKIVEMQMRYLQFFKEVVNDGARSSY